ncbi:hypothetical protein BDZ91DRAFT_734420 [Kalaharituber pfeilii]|nr:hypothetical protein BDZ91DRAFT_734420 [Kalaharituber pfeilii]
MALHIFPQYIFGMKLLVIRPHQTVSTFLSGYEPGRIVREIALIYECRHNKEVV